MNGNENTLNNGEMHDSDAHEGMGHAGVEVAVALAVAVVLKCGY